MTVEVTKKQKTVEVTKKVTDVITVAQPGAAGPPNALSIGTVTVGEPSATITCYGKTCSHTSNSRFNMGH